MLLSHNLQVTVGGLRGKRALSLQRRVDLQFKLEAIRAAAHAARRTTRHRTYSEGHGRTCDM